jgi:hypothetical protein
LNQTFSGGIEFGLKNPVAKSASSPFARRDTSLSHHP